MEYNNVRHYLITSSVYGNCRVFIEKQYAQICLTGIQEACNRNNYSIQALVLMPDHIHGVFSMQNGIPVEELVRRIKGVSSRRLREAFPDLKSQVHPKSFWMKSFHFSQLMTELDIKNAIQYVVDNPIKAGYNNDRLIVIDRAPTSVGEARF